MKAVSIRFVFFQIWTNSPLPFSLSILSLFASMQINVYVCVYVWVWVCVCHGTRVRDQRTALGAGPPQLFWDRLSLLAAVWSRPADLLPCKNPPSSSPLLLGALGFYRCVALCLTLCGLWDSKLKPWFLHSKCFYTLSHLLSPWTIFPLLLFSVLYCLFPLTYSDIQPHILCHF